MIYFGLLALAVGLGLPIAVIGGGLGQGLAASAALEGMARQPEAMGKLQTAMILAFAFTRRRRWHLIFASTRTRRLFRLVLIVP